MCTNNHWSTTSAPQACTLAMRKRAATSAGASELILSLQDLPGGLLCLLAAGQHARVVEVRGS